MKTLKTLLYEAAFYSDSDEDDAIQLAGQLVDMSDSDEWEEWFEEAAEYASERYKPGRINSVGLAFSEDDKMVYLFDGSNNAYCITFDENEECAVVNQMPKSQLRDVMRKGYPTDRNDGWLELLMNAVNELK